MVNTTYEPFSRQPEYIEVNRGFLRSLALQDCETVLDLACGTGTLTELLLHYPSITTIVGLDLSRESLLLACEHFAELGFFGNGHKWVMSGRMENGQRVIFLMGTAECLPVEDQRVDTVIMGNSIHLVPDQDKMLREINRILKPKGTFAFNTSFFAGTYPPGTENLYHQWVKIALEDIQAQDRERRKQGLEGIRRQRGTSHRAFSRKWPTPEEFVELLERNGFEVKWYCHRKIIMNQRGLETIGAYAHMAAVLLSGYPVEMASRALEAAAGPAFKAFGSDSARRLWLEVVAVKK